ncbi:MAG: hypothetical protein OXU98_06500 [Gammaproteobacteria bacterium]|nr:hypothetical protein [Gammaproteobacteria bacterium]
MEEKHRIARANNRRAALKTTAQNPAINRAGSKPLLLSMSFIVVSVGVAVDVL